MRVREGQIPFLERHLARVGRSLGALGLPKPSQDIAALARPFAAMGDAVLRVEVRDGRASVTVRDVPALAPPAVITASEPHQPYLHKTTERDCFEDAAAEAEVAEADALAEQRSSDRVREAEVDRPPERDPERRGDEDDGRGDEEGREETAALSDVLEAPPFRLGRSNRCHVGLSA